MHYSSIKLFLVTALLSFSMGHVSYSKMNEKPIPASVLRQNLPIHFKNEYRSKYFVFHYHDDIKTIPALARFCDGYIDFIDRELSIANFDYPIHIYVLKNRTSMQRFLIDKAGESDPPGFGIYFHDIKSFITYEGSGNGTFSHEIMHPLLFKNLNHLPLWAVEGIPCFFEKSFGYWDQNRLILRLGFQNPWRIKALGKSLLSLDLEQILTTPNYGHNEKRLVSIFLHKHGILKKYIQLVRSNQKNGYNTFFEASFERPLSQIIPDWTEYLNDVYKNRGLIDKIPMSEIFESKEQFDQTMKKPWAVYSEKTGKVVGAEWR